MYGVQHAGYSLALLLPLKTMGISIKKAKPQACDELYRHSDKHVQPLMTNKLFRKKTPIKFKG